MLGLYLLKKMKVNFNYFPNIGYITADVPSDLLLELDKIINEKELERYNKNLAGNIRKEFFIKKAIPIFQNYILDLCLKYDDEFNYLKGIDVCTNDVPLILHKMWVNFQEKHEFNPLHTHSGLFSFVIWIKIPFYNKDEKNSSPGKDSNHNLAGCFEFQYCNSLGSIIGHSIQADKEWEGKICLFPANLNHSVYPFYSSNDYRISVSGNVCLKT